MVFLFIKYCIPKTIKAKPIPICGVYVGHPSLKKIIKSIYSDKPTKLIINIIEIQFIKLFLNAKILIDFMQTKRATIVGIKNQ